MTEPVEEDGIEVFSFRIGDVFPVENPVARFVTGIAMIANDWGRLFRLSSEVRDDEFGSGTRMLLYRLQLSLHVEAVKFLRDARRQYPREIDRFLETLTEEGRELHQILVDENSLTRMRATPVRNQSFHYPRVLRDRYERGSEEMARLLSEAAHLDGVVEIVDNSDGMGEYRFADEVIVQSLPATDGGQTDEEAVDLFKDRVLVLRRFAHLAISQYLAGAKRPDEFSHPQTFEIDLQAPVDVVDEV